MTKYVHLVFSDPPAHVSESEYNEWYDKHVEEILAVDGWVSATRYRITPEVGADESGGYRFLSLYELDCPPEQHERRRRARPARIGSLAVGGQPRTIGRG